MMFAAEAKACSTYKELYAMVLENCSAIQGNETALKKTIEYYMELRLFAS